MFTTLLRNIYIYIYIYKKIHVNFINSKIMFDFMHKVVFDIHDASTKKSQDTMNTNQFRNKDTKLGSYTILRILYPVLDLSYTRTIAMK